MLPDGRRSLLVALALVALLQRKDSVNLVECSSYLDEYFLPTAKLALNKLQQSLSSSSAQDATQQQQQVNSSLEKNLSISEQATQNQVQVQADNTEKARNDETRVWEEPPNKGDFVRLLELGGGGSVGQEQVSGSLSTGVLLATPTSSAAPESSTSATPTSGSSSSSGGSTTAAAAAIATAATPTEQSNAESAQGSATQANQVPALANELEGGEGSTVKVDASEAPSAVEPSKEEKTVEGAESSAAAAGGVGNERPALVVDAPQLDEASRETELDAVAAVDASIGFGQSELFGSLSDTCYDEYGNARFCEPEFENAAFERQVEASSECGQPASRFCTAFLNEHNDQIRNCHICDAQHPKKRHPAAYLTDLNNFNSPTCWVSAPLLANSSVEHLDNVTLTLNFDKKYEISYISMQFCSMRPDSLAIYKSSDFGKSWSPYQFYSSQCLRVYKRAPRPPGANLRLAELSSLPEASCLNSSVSSSSLSSSLSLSAGQAVNSGRVAFSPLGELRGAGGSVSGGQQHAVERSQTLQEWISATNLRVVLDRHQPAAWSLHAPQASAYNATNNNNNKEQQQSSAELTAPSDAFNYALADLTVGGRCKCNGHASRCVHGKDGRLQCDCRHNTAGRDCERCAPFHFDRPWQRATQNEANPCQPCNCNGHSRKCRFDAEIYHYSGRRSGGVCHGCRDNTAGRHCDYCKEGFTRDHSKPMSDKEACKHCDCHPLGSKGRVCNQTSGQCPCKEGVAGLQCNRCAPGYQQSSSSEEPCIKLPENDINYEPSLTVDGADESQAAPAAAAAAVVEQRHSSSSSSSPPAAHSIGSLDNNSQLAELQPPLARPSGGADKNSPDNNAKDDDTSSEQQMNELSGSSARQINTRLWNAAHLRPAQKVGQQQHPYYRYATRARQPLYNLEAANAELDEEQGRNLLAETDQGDFVPRQNFAVDYNKRFSQQEFRQQNRRNRIQKPVLEQPDDLMIYDDQETPVYVAPPNSLYNDDSFNLIHQQPAPTSSSRRQQQAHLNQRSQNHLRLNNLVPFSAARRNFAQAQSEQESLQSLQAAQARAFAVPNSIACGDCHLATRRLVFKQFCHLDYAIRANILSKQVAEDWTKFELEVLDIFKSPSSGLLANQVIARSAYLEAAGQGELETKVRQQQQPGAGNSSSSSSSSSSSTEPNEAPQNRIKVGTLQTIWVPTEDLSCKCPKLKPKSMYLLMGSMDAKENSAFSFQLDRHGVALEWRASLQDKLIKYQRRHSRGRC